MLGTLNWYGAVGRFYLNKTERQNENKLEGMELWRVSLLVEADGGSLHCKVCTRNARRWRGDTCPGHPPPSLVCRCTTPAWGTHSLLREKIWNHWTLLFRNRVGLNQDPAVRESSMFPGIELSGGKRVSMLAGDQHWKWTPKISWREQN